MIDFPSSPTVDQTYTFNGRTWKWNGSGWEIVGSGGSGGGSSNTNIDGGLPDSSYAAITPIDGGTP